MEESLKSNVSDPTIELMQSVYLDACMKCPAENVSDVRDLKTIRSRVKMEGISFLTITLPSFSKTFEKCLEKGFVDPTDFPGFRKSGAIPAFLRGMLGRLFDHETGRLYEEVPHAPVFVEAVRQVCLLFKKIELPCSALREREALENFTQVEHLNEVFTLDPPERDRFLYLSDLLWGSVLGDIHPSALIPRHGPGATAESISGNQKYDWRRWHERLEPYFPFLSYAYSVFAAGEDSFEKVTFVQPEQEQPVKVTLVPKTLKGPRVIAIEPVCNQYTQQAIQSALYARIEHSKLMHGRVNFTRQSINQRLALKASRTGRRTTIDLSDASDRVPFDLAIQMFRSNPDLQGAVEACRSTRAVLPNGRVIGPLKKFASMGSALCFPVEAMYFYTICVKALLDSKNLPYDMRHIRRACRRVYVYGDDIIVPTDQAGVVLDYLQRYNCKVNLGKTFKTGKFRESCGMDAYDGERVTPVYLRQTAPENKQQAGKLISWVATANLFYLKGYWRTASLMFCTCEKILGPLPYVSLESTALGRVSYLGYVSAHGWIRKTQTFSVKAWVPRAVYRSDRIDGYPALQKCLLSLERRSPTPRRSAFDILLDRQRGLVPESVDKKHLERTARRGAVTLKLRWVPAT